MLYTNPEIESSYQKNDLGRTLYDLVIELKPKRIVEFGVLNGYSTVCMAMALHQLGRGKVTSYDLWEKYDFSHGNLADCMWEVMRRGLGRFVQFERGSAFDVELGKCDMVHLDISNDGPTVRKFVTRLRKMGYKGPIVFEGGSRERDQVPWMLKYGRQPIEGCGVDYKIINSKFPSISIA